ncbi:hypothetical protein D3C74_471530 [compost metagenome]
MFQGEEDPESTIDGLDQENTDVEVAGEGNTLEARVAALEKAVFGEIKGAA